MRIALRVVLTAAGMCFVAGKGLAQECRAGGPANPPAVKNALVGIVLDTQGSPLRDVDVFIRNPRRQVKTDTTGQFRIGDLKRGEYDVSVRRIGYEPQQRAYVVMDSGGVARFCLIEEPRSLAAMVSSAARGGLSGVVGDTAYMMVPGAEVRAMGEGHWTRTDSMGAFHLPLNPGRYAISIEKPGFIRQIVGVTVPRDSGRRMVAWLTPGRMPGRLALAYDNMRTRILSRRPASSALLSREDLMNTSGDLVAAVRASAKAIVKEDCEVVIDGGPFTVPLYVLDKRDVEFFETYLPRPPRGVTSIGGRPPRPPGSGACPTMYAWLKP